MTAHVIEGYLITALILTVIIPAAGIVIGFVRGIIFFLISLISSGLSFVIENFLTFPGVMHHELSHALFGFITGAKITKINLFKPEFENMSLGSVELVYRGPWLLQCIQACFSAMAPVVTGFVTCSLIYFYLLPAVTGTWVAVPAYYLLFSVFVHMTMSFSDAACYIKGAVGVYIIVLVICILAGFSIPL